MKDFLKEVGFSISVCDKDGIITYMNDKGSETFSKQGGRGLIGSQLLDCHPEPSRTRLIGIMQTRETQSYFKGEGETKRLIHQTPVYKHGIFDGYIELIIPLPGL